MSYIINNTNPFVSIKLTEMGRQQLALGQLNFSYWGIGDSEINYGREEIVDANPTNIPLSGISKVLRPFDQQPDIKYFITSNTNNNPYQDLLDANKQVIKAVVNNQAEERGFFLNSGGTYTTLTANTFVSYSQSISNAKLTGGTSLDLTTSAITVGDIILLKVGNTTIGNVALTESTRAIPNLWYKVQAKTATNVTLDRKLPNYSAQTATTQVLVYRGGEVYDTIASGNTTAYWDSGTLAFQANDNVTCHDVPVWNMNNVWAENPAGINGLPGGTYEEFPKFGSYQYLGFMNPYTEYLSEVSADTTTVYCNNTGNSYIDGVKKSLSIIHFTNNSISNLYGEFLYVDATNNKQVEVYLPELMYHRRNYKTASGTTMGMKFIATGFTNSPNLIGNSQIQYYDLIEDETMISSGLTAAVVGKVFPQLKMIVFDNDEIVAALSYKSNRNWTLPELNATLSAPSGGTSTGVLQVGQTMYLTYSLENSGTTSGLTTSLPCQTYVKITNTTSGPKDIDFRLIGTDLLPYMRKLESSYDGYGFHAHKFKLVYQIVADADIRPTSSAWKTYDFTTTAITGVAGQTINPKLLENQTPLSNGFILDSIKDSAATVFDITQQLNMAQDGFPNNLQFGDERFFYGNINTYIGATIFKTIFSLNIGSNYFNRTTNPTRSTDLSTNPPNIKLSEVGIYDSNKNLVCIGKVSSPISIGGNTIMLELSIDF